MTQNSSDVFRGHGITIELATPDDFLKVKETLTRIGVKAKPKEGSDKQRLIQSCFILHKRGKYAIMHFKELFMIDGKKSDIIDEDYAKRDRIANLLQEWGLLEINDTRDINWELSEGQCTAVYAGIKIVPFKEKANWEFVSKYHIGN